MGGYPIEKVILKVPFQWSTPRFFSRCSTPLASCLLSFYVFLGVQGEPKEEVRQGPKRRAPRGPKRRALAEGGPRPGSPISAQSREAHEGPDWAGPLGPRLGVAWDLKPRVAPPWKSPASEFEVPGQCHTPRMGGSGGPSQPASHLSQLHAARTVAAIKKKKSPKPSIISATAAVASVWNAGASSRCRENLDEDCTLTKVAKGIDGRIYHADKILRDVYSKPASSQIQDSV